MQNNNPVSKSSESSSAKFQVKATIFVNENKKNELTEECRNITGRALPIFYDSCSSTDDTAVLYVLPYKFVSDALGLYVQLFWVAPVSIRIAGCPEAEICAGRTFGEESVLCGACYCVEIYYRYIMDDDQSTTRKLLSVCGITVEEFAHSIDLEENDLSCGYFEVVVFGANIHGNGKKSSAFISLSSQVINSIKPTRQIKDGASFLVFDLPVRFNYVSSPQVSVFDCQSEMIELPPPSSVKLSSNGSLTVPDTVGVDDDNATYRINFYDLDFPSEDLIPSSEIAHREICSNVRLFRQLIAQCVNQTITVATTANTPPETTTITTSTDQTTTASSGSNAGVIAGTTVSSVILSGATISVVTVIVFWFVYHKKNPEPVTDMVYQ